MKKLAFLFIGLLLSGISVKAASNAEASTFRGYDGSSYIFVEGNVEFSVFPDGQFDFVFLGQSNGVNVSVNTPGVSINYNSGYNYDAFVQYDDYGAVIQVENTPIFYDYYGRVSQIGNVDIWYNNGRVRRIGGLHVYYNGGVFSHYTGYINIYNRGYVYRPFHRYFARPSCIQSGRRLWLFFVRI